MSAKALFPCFENLGATPPEQVDADSIGREWVESLDHLISIGDLHGIVSSLLLDTAWWRDLFALTWDIRTFHGSADIEKFLQDRGATTGFCNIAFMHARYQHVFPDLAWVVLHFSFETAVGLGSGIARLVYTKDAKWKAVSVSSQLDGLKGHPERVGKLRNFNPASEGSWAKIRQRKLEFADKDPEVLIIGGGQSGLEVAARLAHLGVSHLIVEKNARIGDNWRKRYESLNLHDPLCACLILLELHLN